jgi:hypothetical protein
MDATRVGRIATLVAVISAGALPAAAQLQSKHQIKCINELNKSAILVSLAQGDDNAACIKAAGKGDLSMTAQDCLGADLRSKVARRQQRTVDMGTSKCSIEQPTFGATDADTVNTGASGAQIDLTAALFGADVDAALVDCDEDNAACKCQARVARATARLASTRIKTYAECAKRAVEVNKEPFRSGAVAPADLEACVSDPATPWSVAADERGKIAGAATKLAAAATSCPAGDLFPGDCSGESGPSLADCLAGLAACNACLTINEISSLDAACAACVP